MSKLPCIFKISGVVKNYDWGGTEFIPQLLDLDNSKGNTYAELWFGAHPLSPSVAKIKAYPTLENIIAENGAEILGSEAMSIFDGRLPFLLKILDVKKMLSIQSHPTKAQAKVGFDRENKKEISLSAYDRVFKDDNHKPELMVALTDFYLLHGFAHMKLIKKRFEQLIPSFSMETENLKSIFDSIFALTVDETEGILNDLRKNIDNKLFDKSDVRFWIQKAIFEYFDKGNPDKGILLIMMMNVVFLEPGMAIFQDAGVMHAYLEGKNVEIMANSDNVFRGGLSSKYINEKLLDEHIEFTSIKPEVLEKGSDFITNYHHPAKEFSISLLEISERYIHPSFNNISVILNMGAKTILSCEEHSVELKAGECCIITPNTRIFINPNDQKAKLFLISVP